MEGHELVQVVADHRVAEVDERGRAPAVGLLDAEQVIGRHVRVDEMRRTTAVDEFGRWRKIVVDLGCQVGGEIAPLAVVLDTSSALGIKEGGVCIPRRCERAVGWHGRVVKRARHRADLPRDTHLVAVRHAFVRLADADAFDEFEDDVRPRPAARPLV